jgi:4'-phosphopantetheinyl transferase EntD
MTTVHTLDERLRRKALEDLEKEVNALFLNVQREFRGADPQELSRAAKHTSVSFRASTLIEALKKALYKALAPAREQKAIDDFLSRLDALGSQVDQLRDEVLR